MNNNSGQCSRRTFIVDMALAAEACALVDPIRGAAFASSFDEQKLGRASPESVGVDPVAVLAFIKAVNEKVGGLHGMMLLRHGKVVAEGWWAPYNAASPHMLYSLSKSFTSTAVGLAISDGLLSVEDLVTSFFKDSLPATVDANLAAMRVRHLLTMTTGHDVDATGATTSQPDGDWVRGFLAIPVDHEPGTKFVYNSAATYMLSAIVQKLTGKTVLDYLTPRLFTPLGIVNMTWETCPRGINCGGWGLSIKTEDIARFGQLYLQHGAWRKKQIVPRTWVDQATSRQVSNGDPTNPSDWNQGYGYQFWRCRHGAFRGDGAFGQYCIVMPEQDAVVAINSGLADMQAVLNAVWDHLLPGIPASDTVPGASDTEMRNTLKSLSVPVPAGKPSSPTVARVSGKTYRFETNPQQIETLELVFKGNLCKLTMHRANGIRSVECSPEKWLKGTATLDGTPSTKVAAKGSWTQEDTYTATLCFVETPFVQTIACQFAQDAVTLTVKQNIGFGPNEYPPLVGKLA